MEGFEPATPKRFYTLPADHPHKHPENCPASGAATRLQSSSVGSAYSAAIGSIRLGSLFLTLPTRVLTGQLVISSAGQGASKAFKRGKSAASSPSQAGHVSGPRTTGIRSWSSAHSSFGLVVTIAKLRTHSPAGERQFSHSPAKAMRRRSASATA